MYGGATCHSRLARARQFTSQIIESLPQHHFATPRRHTVSNINTPMAAPMKCMATAVRSNSGPRAARVTHRTFAFSTSSPVASSRKPSAGNATCRRGLQTTRIGPKNAASSFQGHTRGFSQSTPRSKLKTIDQIRARNKGGVRFDIQGAMYQMGVLRRPFKG